jgi:hypothetical protein
MLLFSFSFPDFFQLFKLNSETCLNLIFFFFLIFCLAPFSHVFSLVFILIFIMDKTYIQFLRLGTLGSIIEFKYMVALTNETQTMLSFPRIFKFNTVMYYPFIIILLLLY